MCSKCKTVNVVLNLSRLILDFDAEEQEDGGRREGLGSEERKCLMLNEYDFGEDCQVEIKI